MLFRSFVDPDLSVAIGIQVSISLKSSDRSFSQPQYGCRIKSGMTACRAFGFSFSVIPVLDTGIHRLLFSYFLDKLTDIRAFENPVFGVDQNEGK